MNKEEIQKRLVEINATLTELRDANPEGNYNEEDTKTIDALVKESNELRIQCDEIDTREQRTRVIQDTITHNDYQIESPLQRAYVPPVQETAPSPQEGENVSFRDAFNTALTEYHRTRDVRGIYEMLAQEHRAIGTQPNMQGGDIMIPETMENDVVRLLRENNALRQLCTLRTGVRHGRKIPVQKLGDDGQITAEGVQIPVGNDVQFTEVELSLQKFTYAVRVNNEMFEDVVDGFDLYGYIRDVAAEQIGALEEAELMKEVLTGITKEVETAQSGKVSGDELLDFQGSIISRYQPNSSFITNQSTILAIRKLKDNNARYLYDQALRLGEMSSLMGAPLVQSSAIDTFDKDKTVMLYGNFKKYGFFGQARAITIKVEDEPQYDRTNFWVTMRSGIVITNPAAFAKLKIKA